MARWSDLYTRTETEVEWNDAWIKPYAQFKMEDGGRVEFPLGVFLVSSPVKQERGGTTIRNIEAYDGSIILNDDRFMDRYIIPEGTKIIDAVIQLLESAGIDNHSIDTSSEDTLRSDREYEPGESKLSAINDLLGLCNYTSIWVDANGIFRAFPYVSPQRRSVEYKYAADDLSVIFTGAELELDLFNIPNAWVVTVSNPDEEPLVSTYENVNEDSVTSIPNRRRRIVEIRELDSIPSQEALDNYVERIAFESSQVYGRVRFETAIMPFHEYLDVIQFSHPKLKEDEKYTITDWSLDLEAGGRMQHEARRVVNV